MKRDEPGSGTRGKCDLILWKVVKKGFSEEMPIEQDLKGVREGRNVDVWKKKIPGRGNTKCKDPEVIKWWLN